MNPESCSGALPGTQDSDEALNHPDFHAADESTGKKSVAQHLIELGVEQHLFADIDGDGFMQVCVGAHSEVYGVDSRQARDWLAAEYFRRTKKGANRGALADAVATLSARARFSQTKRQSVRLASCVWTALFSDQGETAPGPRALT